MCLLLKIFSRSRALENSRQSQPDMLHSTTFRTPAHWWRQAAEGLGFPRECREAPGREGRRGLPEKCLKPITNQKDTYLFGVCEGVLACSQAPRSVCAHLEVRGQSREPSDLSFEIKSQGPGAHQVGEAGICLSVRPCVGITCMSCHTWPFYMGARD